MKNYFHLHKNNPRLFVFIWALAVTLAMTFMFKTDYINKAREILKSQRSLSDTTRYIYMTVDLAKRPISQIFTPKWAIGDNVYSKQVGKERYVIDHYAGQFLLPVLLAKLGFPSDESYHLSSFLFKICSLYLLFLIFSPYFGNTSYSLLYGTIFSGIFLNYLVRSTQEPILLFSFLFTVYSVNLFLKNSKWIIVLALGLSYSFLVKGFLSLNIPFFLVLYLWSVSPSPKVFRKKLTILVFSFLSIPLTIYLYDIYFKALTGLPFWENYLKIQIFGRSGAKEPFVFMNHVKIFFFYLGRTITYAFPWSFVAIGLLIRSLIKSRLKFSIDLKDTKTRIYLCALFFIFSQLIAFSFFKRTASRYLFTSYFLCIAISILYCGGQSSIIQKVNQKIFRSIGPHVFATLLWTTFITLYFTKYF